MVPRAVRRVMSCVRVRFVVPVLVVPPFVVTVLVAFVLVVTVLVAFVFVRCRAVVALLVVTGHGAWLRRWRGSGLGRCANGLALVDDVGTGSFFVVGGGARSGHPRCEENRRGGPRALFNPETHGVTSAAATSIPGGEKRPSWSRSKMKGLVNISG